MSLTLPATRMLPMGEESNRLYPTRPYLAVSLAVFRAGRVLIARRGRAPYFGAFSLPGGVVKTGETLEAAALRELREEVAVEARIVGFNQWMESIERDAAGRIRQHYVIASFIGYWISGEARPGPEAREILWVLPAEFNSLEVTPGLVRVVQSAETFLRQAGSQ
ncbi:MAG: NUDIX hydrolase [Alphaproteobacteria bacterium]|nr:NUDIX hydrolase [Alphaproteobacteria bacterium]